MMNSKTQHKSSEQESNENKSSVDLDISLTNEKKHPNNTSFSGLMGDVQKFLLKPRSRGVSHDDELTPHKFFQQHTLSTALAEKWKEETFDTEDDRIGSFLDYLSKF